MTPEQQAVIEEAEAHLEAMKLSYGWPLTPYVDLLALAKDLAEENKRLQIELINRKEILQEDITDEEYDILEGAS